LIGKVISHYKILEKLGEGEMGIVYLAHDTELDRHVVIRFLPEHLTKNIENVERFKRKAKAAAALNHPNIVTIYDVIEADGQICIVMEYVDGHSLRMKIDGGFSDTKEVLDITTQICEGLSEAHKADIVHRDIKPENILIDSCGRIKILDFGLAKLKGVSKLTGETSTLGTIHYMSPEQIQAHEVDQLSDIWSLGVVLYEMLIGGVPFKGDYEQAVLYAIFNEELKDLKNIPLELQDIVKKILAKNKAYRYQNIEAVLTELKETKSILHEPKVRRTSHYKISSFLNKKTAISAIITILLLTILSFIYFTLTNRPKETSKLKRLSVYASQRYNV
jgi:serine/threonine protein kinase